MKKRFNIIQKYPLFKITSLNTLALSVKVVTGFITSKALAYFLGPQGMALTGNLQNFLSTTQGIATAGLYNGIVAYTAQHKEDAERLKRILSSSLLMMGIATLVCSATLILGAGYWTQLIFGNPAYKYIFIVLGILLPMHIANIFCLAILNGYENYRKYLYINIVGYVFTLGITVILVWKHTLHGALLAIVIIPALLLPITLTAIKRQKKITLQKVAKKYTRDLADYALMTLVSAISVPVGYLLIRNYIIQTIGIQEAGYWEAMNRIAAYYLMFVMSLMGLYILPKMAEAHSNEGFRTILKDFYKTVFPVFIVGLVLVYNLRFFLVKLVLSDEFLPTAQLFFWQNTGDVFRVAATVIAYRFHAKKQALPFILSEIGSVLSLYLLSVYFLNTYRLEGAVMAYACNYALYFLTVLIIFRKPLFRDN